MVKLFLNIFNILFLKSNHKLKAPYNLKCTYNCGAKFDGASHTSFNFLQQVQPWAPLISEEMNRQNDLSSQVQLDVGGK